MSTQTRRRLFLGLVAAVILLPPEYLAISALRNQNRPLQLVWLDGMNSSARLEAARKVQDYPVAYRRALLAGLSPAARAQAWRENTAAYMNRHPALTAAQIVLLRTLITADTEEVFRRVPSAMERLNLVASSVRSVLGEEAYRDLLFDVGPPDARSAHQVSALPMRVRLEDLIRARFLVQAMVEVTCECRMGQSADCGSKQWCGTDFNCTSTTTGCGIQQAQACDGMCFDNPIGGL